MTNNLTALPHLTAASSDLRTIHIATDMVRALTGALTAPVYAVELHALPGRVFHVEAPDTDTAQARAVAVVRAERSFPMTGATVRRLG
jgi:hypothetical protein